MCFYISSGELSPHKISLRSLLCEHNARGPEGETSGCADLTVDVMKRTEVGAFPHVVRTEPTPPGVGPTTNLSARLDSLFCFFTTLPHIYASIMLVAGKGRETSGCADRRSPLAERRLGSHEFVARPNSLFCFILPASRFYVNITLVAGKMKQDHTAYGLATNLVETEGLEPATSRM